MATYSPSDRRIGDAQNASVGLPPKGIAQKLRGKFGDGSLFTNPLCKSSALISNSPECSTSSLSLSSSHFMLRRKSSNISLRKRKQDEKERGKAPIGDNFLLPKLEPTITGSFSNTVSLSLAQRGLDKRDSDSTTSSRFQDIESGAISGKQQNGSVFDTPPYNFKDNVSKYSTPPELGRNEIMGRPTLGMSTPSSMSLRERAQKMLHPRGRPAGTESSLPTPPDSPERQISIVGRGSGAVVDNSNGSLALFNGPFSSLPTKKLSASNVEAQKIYTTCPTLQGSLDTLQKTNTLNSVGGVKHLFNVSSAVVSPVVRLTNSIGLPTSRSFRSPSIPSRRSSLKNNPSAALMRLNTSDTLDLTLSPDCAPETTNATRRTANPRKCLEQRLEASIFEYNTSEEEEIRLGKHLYKALRRQKAREMLKEDEMDSQGRAHAIHYCMVSYCLYGCKKPRCFHDCDVLHIKTTNGHDCLVLEMIDNKPTVIAGSVDGLILELCTPLTDKSDETFTDVFLRTHGCYIPSHELLQGIIENFKENQGPLYQQRALSVLARWLLIQPDDLLQNQYIYEKLIYFLDDEVHDWGYKKLEAEIQDAISKAKANRSAYKRLLQRRSRVTLSDKLADLKVKLAKELEMGITVRGTFPMEIGVDDLAKYFAALDLVFFRDASQARTLKCWNERIAHPDESHDSDRAILVSRVERIFLRSKMIKDWITYELLGALHRDQLEMTRYLEKFIELAKRLLEFGNFQTSLEIASALLQPGLFGLDDKAWMATSEDSLNDLEKLKLLLEDEATYNDLVEDAPVPVVPCMRRWLGKLNSLGTGIKYHASTDFALKRHMDLKVDNCGYIFVPEKLVKPIPPSCENPPLEMIDIAKHRAILEEITRARKKAWRAYDFERLGKLAWIFTYHVPGRTAFCKRTVADGPIRNSSYTEESVATAGAGQFHGEEDISSAETSIYKKNDESSPRSSTNTKIYQEPKVGVNKGLGELDWVSEIVERRILEVAAWNAL